VSETIGASIRRGILRCTASAVLFGISAPAASRLTGDLGAFSLAGLLYLGAAIAVLPVLRRTKLDRLALQRGAGRLATAVVIGGAVGPVLLAAGLSHAPAATASLLLNLELVFTTVLAFFVFNEHVGRRVVAGTMFVFAAGLILSWSGNADLRWGSLLIAAACLCWAVDNCVTAALDELAPSHITFAKGLIAGTANLAIGLILDGMSDAGAVLAALVVGGFGYGASITLWVAGARDLGAARAQLVFATAPFVGAIVAWTAFGEGVKGREVAALFVAAVGVAFVLRSGHEHEHRHEPLWHDHEHRHDDGHHTHVHEDLADSVVHQHRHHHDQLLHAHPHVPDLHHKHAHS
jgi:drug/metabolite transporter (DMT)-like permease